MKTGDPTTIQTEARELLAAEYRRNASPRTARDIQRGEHSEVFTPIEYALAAITTARDEARSLALEEAARRVEVADNVLEPVRRYLAAAIRALGKDES